MSWREIYEISEEEGGEMDKLDSELENAPPSPSKVNSTNDNNLNQHRNDKKTHNT